MTKTSNRGFGLKPDLSAAPSRAALPSPTPERAMPSETITTHDVSRARFILETVTATLLEADPQLRDDDALFADMLDGEGGDAVDLLRAALRASLEADAQARACKARIGQLAERQRRHEGRAAALEGAVHQAMRDLGIPRLRDAEFTASRREGGERVEVADAALLPPAYVRTRQEPDKAALLAALKAGQAIPGAVLAQGDETLTVKVK